MISRIFLRVGYICLWLVVLCIERRRVFFPGHSLAFRHVLRAIPFIEEALLALRKPDAPPPARLDRSRVPDSRPHP